MISHNRLISSMDSSIQKIKDSITKNELNGIDLIQYCKDSLSFDTDKKIYHEILHLAHLKQVSLSIQQLNQVEIWIELLIKIIEISNFNTGYLIKQRANHYKDKTAFNIIHKGKIKTLSYSNLWKKISSIGKAISTFENGTEIPTIGLLTNNQLNGALLDLACLSFGFKVIPIPLNATPEHISYIIYHAEISHIFIGGKTSYKIWNKIYREHPITTILLDFNDDLEEGIIQWEDFLERGNNTNKFNINHRLDNIDMYSNQTIMYTSGTTDNPKGIMFNQMNIVSKRFSRAIALSEIGNEDIFLCYLPLFHTFGRYFELLGSIFWGATYSFAESPAFNSLLNDFKIIKPTIFISIPKRWLQLYEMLDNQLELDTDKKEIIKDKIKKITGGRLKWGLSAAGYLDPDIFIFFNNHNINLLSGYGMTEATGGITMTPPNEYIKNSVGKILPGIQIKIENDGELCLKGHYVTDGYFKDVDSKVFVNGWFHTQDIFKKKNGHYFIVDRKKDIYKNSRGQTIAPQKIENLFQDFDQIKSVFLVGDGKEFNSVLIYPDNDNIVIDLDKTKNIEIRNIFSSMILSVNSFLSPFERIINFVVINRDFSNDMGERTPKGTFIRKKILENFKDIIEPLYEKNYSSLHYNNKEIRFPNWLIREIGTVNNNLKWDGKTLFITDNTKSIPLIWSESNLRIGDFYYKTQSDILEFDSFIQSPILWLGNKEFSKFTGPSIFRLNESKPYNDIKIIPLKNEIVLNNNLDEYQIDNTLYHLHQSIRLFISNVQEVFDDLKSLIDNNVGNWKVVVIDFLITYQKHSLPLFRIKIIEAIAPLLSGKLFISMLYDAYMYQRKIDSSKGLSFDISRTNDEHYKAIIDFINESKLLTHKKNPNEQEFIKTLLLFIADFGVIHPTRFIWARSELISWQLAKIPKPIYSTAQKAYFILLKGFRSWIGQATNITVDPDTGEEYQWDDVIIFDDNVRKNHQSLILHAIKETSIIRESIFLFSKNYLINLNDIPKNGIWVTQLGSGENKCVFRLLVQTRNFGNHNLVINLNKGLDRKFIDDETKWLIKMGKGFKENQLVENFGGYYPEQQIYTEEYIQGETLDKYLERNKEDINDKSKIDRWQMRWLHFIWSGIQAYQEFWIRTDLELSIQPPKPDNLIIPRHDYKRGTRLISISKRKPIQSLSQHFLTLFTDYIIQTEKKYSGLNHMSDWEVIFTATIEALKVEKGKEVLIQLKENLASREIKTKCKLVGLTSNRIDQFLSDIDKFGVLTKPVVFASLRYERWLDLNQEATLQAKASILQGLYKDYNLDSLLDEYPETRVRFFMMTSFKNANQNLYKEFQYLIKDLRKNIISPWNMDDRISEIQKNIKANDEEKFFLARMLFPHIDSADYVELISTKYGEKEQINLVSQIACKDGNLYRIRPPFLPKEIAQYHNILKKSSLSANFSSEHEFLLAFNSRNHIVGGLFWKMNEKRSIHLEWVAIRKKYQKINLSKCIMEDFYKRMKHLGIKYITVGFYAQDFFSKHSFKIEKQYGGMVKRL